MKTIGVVPARYAATRLPGKCLIPLCGKPLIYWVLKNALRAKRLEKVILATDDTRIAEAAEELGVESIMIRSDHVSGTDRIAEAVSGIDAGIIVNIHGDEPLIDPDLIDRLVTVLSDNGWDMATAAAPLRDKADLGKPSVVKVVCDESGRALYFSRSVIPFIRDGDVDGAAAYRRHIGIYAYRKAFLQKMVSVPQCLLEKAEKLEQLRALYIGGRIKVVEAGECGIGVDTSENVKTVEQEIKRREGAGVI